jgi:hypothetical protein
MLLLTTSFSIAQSNEKRDVRLLAKGEIRISSAESIVKGGESINGNSENHAYSHQLDPVSTEIGKGTNNIFLLNKVPALEMDYDRSYKSPSLKAEDLPLVISSEGRKTMSVVLPPFLYFKLQF